MRATVVLPAHCAPPIQSALFDNRRPIPLTCAVCAAPHDLRQAEAGLEGLGSPSIPHTPR